RRLSARQDAKQTIETEQSGTCRVALRNNRGRGRQAAHLSRRLRSEHKHGREPAYRTRGRWRQTGGPNRGRTGTSVGCSGANVRQVKQGRRAPDSACEAKSYAGNFARPFELRSPKEIKRGCKVAACG